MVNLNRYLKRRRGEGRSGERLYLQVPVPKDLRGRFGHTIERCLRTDSLRLARARRDDMLPAIFQMFEAARQEPSLDDALAAARRAELGRAHAAWQETIAARGLSAARQLYGFLLDQLEDDDPPDDWRRRAKRVLLQHGLAPRDEHLARMVEELSDAHLEGAEMAIDGRELPILPQRRTPALPPTVTFTAAAERYVEERRAVWTAHTRVQYEATLRQFGEHVGAGKAIAAVTRTDVADFLAALAKRPSARAGGLPSAPTLNRHANTIATMFKWAKASGLFDGDNPAAGQRRPEGNGRKRHPFAVPELRKLLAACRPERLPPVHSVHSALPWLVWVGAYTGMRLNELCGLRLEDVAEAEGILHFVLTDHPGRRLKSPAAQRRVPVHSKILALGFRAYVEYVRADGHVYLFPGLPPGGPDGKRSWHATKAFTRLRRRLGINRPGLVFHSLRNTVATALHDAGVPEVEAAEVLGHEIETMTYGLYSGGLLLARLRDVVERISYRKKGD